MKVIFYVLDILKTVLRHICMLCEHFKHHNHSAIHESECDNLSESAEDIKTEKGKLRNDK